MAMLTEALYVFLLIRINKRNEHVFLLTPINKRDQRRDCASAHVVDRSDNRFSCDAMTQRRRGGAKDEWT
jgi:antitoxin (DNA-binding transcriptional repressor) of toxin-antitoxin stability system